MQPAGIGQQVIKQHLVDGFAFNLFKVFASCFVDKVGGWNRRKAIGGAGAASQAIIERFFEFLVPIQAPLNNGA